ncbi:oxidoreductase [Aureococcus anophagefferens]|nr:oxidoreductase [Aureococcus anophagefferens]
MTPRLQLLVACAVRAAAASTCGSCCRNASSDAPLHVGVIGAGFAGLGAAQRLTERGCAVTILEARDRVGAETRAVGDYGIDLGPMWLHGVRRHPLRPYVERYGMTLRRSDYDSAIAYNGSRKINSDTVDAWYDAWDRVVYPIVERRQDDTDEDSDLASAIYEAARSAGARAGALAHAAVLSWLDDDVEDSEDSVLREGYGTLAARIAADGNATVLLERVVDGARAEGDGVVVSAAGHDLAFDRVVVALPLGVLQGGAVAFSPPLDAAALGARGAGAAEKYVLVFDGAFWPDEDFLYTLEPALEWLNLDRALGVPGLACFTAGALATELGAKSDAEKQAWLVERLEAMFPDETFAVVAAAFSEWHSDERTRGGWSYVKPGTDYPSNHAALSRPVLGGRGFAGECASNYFGTVHGAWLSGEAAADLAVDGAAGSDDDDDDDTSDEPSAAAAKRDALSRFSGARGASAAATSIPAASRRDRERFLRFGDSSCTSRRAAVALADGMPCSK